MAVSQNCSPTAVTTRNNCCVGDLSIATTVTFISAYAYNSGGVGCETIASVSVPSTVTFIGLLLLFLLLLFLLLL